MKARTPKKPQKRPAEPVLALPNAAAWNQWLARNHASSAGVQLKLAKKGVAGVARSDALDAALAWGWIDSRADPLDAEYFLQRFSPRTAQSPWSKINCAKAEALIAAKLMRPPGLREVERAKTDGRWKRAYASPSVAKVPPDLAAALAKNARARRFFETLTGANRYSILYRTEAAKTPTTRAARIAKFVAMCAAGETIHPARPARAKKPAK